MTLTADEIITPDVDEQILYSARKIQRRWRGSTTGDLAQEARLWALSHPSTMQHFFDDENPKRGWVRMSRSFEKVMEKKARVENAHREGYDPSDEFFYTQALLSLTLPALFDDDIRANGPARDGEQQHRGKSDVAESSNVWETLVLDTEKAWNAADLNVDQVNVLKLKFCDNLTYAEIGKVLGVAQSTAHEKTRKALWRLQRQLGGTRPEACGNDCEDCGGPGTRHAWSNAKSRAVTDNQYEVE